MTDNGTDVSGTPKFLEPPAVTALRQEARQSAQPSPAPMERSLSQDIRDECEDLKEAAEQTLNVVVDLETDGRIKWVSPSWKEVIGTEAEDAEGKLIRDVVFDNKAVFEDAMESLKRDDSRSQIVRFSVKLGPTSVFRRDKQEANIEGQSPSEQHNEAALESTPEENDDVLNLEGQGIMVYETGGGSHTMWMLRPSTEPRGVTIGLPPLLVESLGIGAEMLANYLTVLAEFGISDPAHHPPPMPILCRICERQITPWWFEKHSELCLQEHRAEMDVQIAQDNLNEHRNAIVKVLDALESRHGRTGATDNPGSQPEYKGLHIGPSQSTPSSGVISATSSSSGTPPRSREASTSGLGHGRARSFAVRRPLARIVELILDLCDTALEINTPALKESRTDAGDEVRTQSPQSESRLSQVLQWQSPGTNTLDQEQGLAALSADTESVARAKVNAVFRHRKIIEYSERIRIEFAVLVEECIEDAMHKAERVAAGDLDDSSTSSSSYDGYQPQDTSEKPMPSDQQETAPTAAHGPCTARSTLDPSPGPQPDKPISSTAVSSRSSSSLECPTPRSRRSLGGILSQSLPSKQASIRADSDAADSDSSVLSSALHGTTRTESPRSERGVSRAASTSDGKRRSLYLPGISSSSPRRESPGRNQPRSPLRLSKPRLSTGESLPSPTTSPLLIATELAPPNYAQYHPQSQHRHHRRSHSSTTSPDLGKAPVSPHMTSVASHPPPRAVAPSIKDFEIIKPISKGAFGSVYLSKKKSTGEYFAIKVLKKADMVAKNQITNVKAERAIMMWQGESDFVAKLYWTFSSKDYLYLVMEYLNGGDCASLVKVLGELPEDWAKKYFAEVVLGIEHLHERGIVHRDLKPDNLLIDQKGHLKLTDFGLSRMGLVGRQKRIQKSPNDSAPDLLKQGPFIRSTSLVSSRSASFDFPPENQSSTSTPLITPEVGSLSQPSYFNLNREPSQSREPSRRASGYRSDSGGSDTLGAMFRNFSLHESGESPPMPYYHQGQQPHPGGPIEEETQSEGSDSPHMFPVHHSATNSLSGQRNTPPPQNMIPPAMALFDPMDQNRRFVGTPDYLAPETINGIGQDEMSDWWSLGCILFEFLYGYPPFNASTPEEVFENILNRRINWPEHAAEMVSPEAMHVMNTLMTVNPQERLGSNISEKFPSGGAEVRNHPWLADINWETLLQDEAQFVPAPENPEDTEYFDSRGATLHSFPDELEDQSSPASGSGGEYRPHDALFKVKSQCNSNTGKRGLMPLHIPPHVRDTRSRRLSEPTVADDFGNFNFKNLPILERANKDVIQKLKQEALIAQQRPVPNNTPASTAGPSLEGSPVIPTPVKRTMSQSKPPNHAASPSAANQANSASPSRASQPSSPLLVQFSTGHHERRKTSGSSSTFSPQSSSSAQTGTLEHSRSSASTKMSSSVASSPVKHGKMPIPSPDKPPVASLHRQYSAPSSRPRSHTLGSQESDMSMPKEPFVPGHHKRRSQLFDVSPSSSDNEGDPRAKALLKVQRRRQSARRLSRITLSEGPVFRPLDVLICEDHPVSRLVLERLFEKLRCRTITAVNGSEAMRYALSEIQFDIILTEFKLPQINGADVARMVRDTKSVNTGTPIIAVTGYLKDLPETHHFDHLVEKPPTLSKLTDVLCNFCQWKPPPQDDGFPEPPPAMRLAGLRQSTRQVEDSPSSVSSGFNTIPASSYRASSREDSIGSSYFGDVEPVKGEDIPVITSRAPTDEWKYPGTGGLGISEEAVPAVAATAPAVSHGPGPTTPRKPVSAEGARAKRESIEKKRYEGAESGDDEDEELGNTHGRMRSGQDFTTKTRRSSSKLGTEMMRTNSRGSVVSTTEESVKCPEISGLENTPPSALPGLATVPTSERLDERLERVHIGDEGLEALPEDPEKEDSCTPPVAPLSSTELETAQQSGDTVPFTPPAPQSDPAQLSASAAQEHSDTTQKGSHTPPETAPTSSLTTPDNRFPGKETFNDSPEDTEDTPRPPLHRDTDTALGTGESEETPRASDRERSRTRANIMKWIGR